MPVGQENVPPSRLRAPTKTAAPARGIPAPKPRPLGAATTVEAGVKRKAPGDAPPAKRVASGSGSRPAPAAAAHTMARRSATAAPVPAPAARKAAVPPRPATATGRRPAAPAPAPPPARGPSRAGVRPGAPPSNGDILSFLQEEFAKINAMGEQQQLLQERLSDAKALEARHGLSAAEEEKRELMETHRRDVDELERQILKFQREKRELEAEVESVMAQLVEERQTSRSLRQEISDTGKKHLELQSRLTAAEIRNEALAAEVDRAAIAVSAMKADVATMEDNVRMTNDDAEERIREIQAACEDKISSVQEELHEAETTRRKLHNQVQELKGNIRVFARVRPPLAREKDSPEGLANVIYGDERLARETGQNTIKVVSKTESAMGKEREQVNAFTFDNVFQPKHGQKDVFEEISMLAQSVLDGYNVCIFAYGQTGSGKSWTMEGGNTPNTHGMIPRAIQMIFDVSKRLKGWKYKMEGTFLEVYNDEINDLLGSSQFDSKKHEIKIVDSQMTVTDTVSLPLSSPEEVTALLETARSRRAVAATLMNERSSRSHSVFALAVKGINTETGETCKGILNLVDLAGSERLTSSGAGENKDRLKETININKSLSALADVIGALGQGKDGAHIPYRNSTLTRLLQTSLSGESKTLMLCNLSPLAAHLGETICTLRFAAKVNSTPAGPRRRS